MSVFRRHGLARIAGVLRRNAWQAVPTVIGIVALNFVLLELVPGDAADVIAAESGSATEEGMAQLRRHFGLDLPMLERLWRYLTGIAQFDLGMSPRHNAPVAQLILDRLGNTLLLMGTALGIAVCAGVLLGVLMSARAGKWQDRLLSVVALLLYSTPSFWLGLMAIVLFSVKLGWLPTGGSYDRRGPDGLGRVRRRRAPSGPAGPGHVRLFIAIFARLTRASMLEVSRQDYVRTAESRAWGRARSRSGMCCATR